MAKIREITEQAIIRGTALFTDEIRTDQGFWEQAINQARAEVIAVVYKKEKRIHPAWLSFYRPAYSAAEQEDDCYVKFFVLPAIKLDVNNDGYRYIGSQTQNYALRRVNSRGELATFNQHRITRISSRKPAVLVEDGTLKVYGNPDLQEIEVSFIAANPMDVPTFNKEVDDYPISEELIPMVLDRIFKSDTVNIFNKVPDTVSNSSDTPQIPTR